MHLTLKAFPQFKTQLVDRLDASPAALGRLHLMPEDILFLGDKLDEGGNDHPVKAIGVDSVAVTGWEQTAVAVEAITYVS